MAHELNTTGQEHDEFKYVYYQILLLLLLLILLLINNSKMLIELCFFLVLPILLQSLWDETYVIAVMPVCAAAIALSSLAFLLSACLNVFYAVIIILFICTK